MLIKLKKMGSVGSSLNCETLTSFQKYDAIFFELCNSNTTWDYLICLNPLSTNPTKLSNTLNNLLAVADELLECL